MTRNSRRLQKAVQAIFNDYREKASCPGQVYQNAACGCDNALQMWRGPKGEKGDTGPQGPKGDNAGSFLVDAEFVVDPQGQEPGAYLKLVLIDVAQQEQVVYVDLSYLTDIYEGGNGIDITSMVVAAKLGAGLTFDANGNIASAYQFCDGLDETSNVVKVRLDASNRILGFASGTCGGLTATVGLAPSATGVNLVLTGANGAVLSTVPLNGSNGITVQKTGSGFTWLADPAGLVSSQTGNQLSVSQTDNKLYVGGNTLEYTFGTGAFTLKDSSGATLSSVTVPSAVRMLENMELRTDDGVYLHLTYLRDNGLHAYQDVSLDGLLCHNIDTADDTAAAYSKAVPSGNWQTASINEIGGRTVVWNQLYKIANSSESKTENNVTVVDNRDGSYTVSTTAEGASVDTIVTNCWILIPAFNYFAMLGVAGTNLKWGGTLVWPVVGNDYVSQKTASQGSWAFRVVVPQGTIISSPIVIHPRVHNLTLMFGAGNEPSSVAEFEAMFPTIDPAYDAGTLKSAGVTEVVSRGRNLAKEDIVVSTTAGTSLAVFPEPIFFPNLTISFYCQNVTYRLASAGFIGYSNGTNTNYILPGRIRKEDGTNFAANMQPYTGRAYVTITNSTVMNIWLQAHAASWSQTSGTIYDIQVEAASQMTSYSAPFSRTLPIPSAIQALPGYGWSAGTVYNYVDYARKVYVQRVGAVNLGAETTIWFYSGAQQFFSTQLSDASNTTTNAIVQGYVLKSAQTGWANMTDFEFGIVNGSLRLHNSAYTNSADFKNSIQGKKAYYELATPIETDISQYLSDDNLIEVEEGGTLTFKNQNGDDFRLPVPNSETFIYEHPWVFEDCIKELVWRELEPYSSSIVDVSASFECRAVTPSIAPAFGIEICDYWDDGESDGCYSSDYLSDTLDFSMLSGTEQKLGTLSLANNTPTNPVVSFGMGDAINSQTPLSLARRELLVSGDASALYSSGTSNTSVSSLAVGNSLAFTFSSISVTEYDGTYYNGRTIALDAPAQTVEISSEVLGTFTISARVVREPDVDGKFTVSFYATATLADASSSTVPTLTLTTTDVSGDTHEQEIDMSCITAADISLDARCEDVVTPGTAEPFDDYILDGTINTLLLEQDGTISDLKHANAIPFSGSVRGSFTMELFNPESTDGLSIELSARSYSGSDSVNEYSNVDPEADSQKCATLADFLAAGEQGLPLPYVEETSFSGVTPFAENETLYASVVSNGNNSYTFTFTVHTPEVVEQELTLDLVSGENRTDLKPLLEHIGGKVGTVSVPVGDAVQLPLGYAGAGYIFGNRRSDFPTSGLFANSAEDICAQTNLVQPTTIAPGADTFNYYFDTLPTHFTFPVINEVDATGIQVGTTSYFLPSMDMETMQCTGEGTALADIPETGLVCTEYDTSSFPYVSTGRTIRLRATVGNAGIVFTLWQQETVDKPVLCLEPSCDPCIDLSPVMDTVDEMIDGALAPVQEQVTQNASDIASLETKTDITNKNVANLQALLNGTLYREETDSTEAYSKTVPTGAMPYASVNEIGGRTVVWNQLLTVLNSSQSKTLNDVSLVDNRDGTYTVSTEAGGATADATFVFTQTVANLQTGHKYLYRCTPAGGSTTTYYAYLVNNSIISSARDFGNGCFYSATGSNVVWEVIFVANGAVITTPIVFKPRLIDLTLMFGAGNEPSTVAEFEAMFPNIDPAYDAGTLKSAGVTEVASEGKNLLIIQPVYKTSSDIKADALSSLYSPVIAEQQYTFSCNSVSGATSWRWGVKAYDTNGNVISDSAIATELTRITFSSNGYYWNSGTNAYTNTTNTTGKTFTFTPHFTGFVRVFICFGDATTSTVVSNAQLERGSTATTYTPYFSRTLPIPSAIQSLPGYGWSAGTVYNYVDYERKVYVQNVGNVVLDGTSKTVTTVAKSNATQNYFCTIINTGVKESSRNFASTVFSNDGSSVANIANIYSNSANIIVCVLPDQTLSTASAVNSWLELNNIPIYYELATPIETDISQYLSDDNLINVEAGGTLTFKNQHGDDFRLPVPNEETYIIDIQEAVSNG